MNLTRRLLSALLIILLCLFAIQSAGAAHAFTPDSTDPLCADIQPLPENFPDWIEKPERSNEQCASANTGLMCDSLGPRTGNSAPMSVLPPDAVSEAYDQRNGPECAIAAGASESAGVRVPIEGSIVAMNEQPGNAMAARDASTNDAVAGESQEPDLLRGRPSQIGPTM